MAYMKQTWQNGDTITAEKLNHMEDGIAEDGGRFDVNVTMEYQTDHYEVTDFDKTVEEINTAYNEGKNIIAHADIMGASKMLNLFQIGDYGAEFSSCDVMGNQAHIFYLTLGSNSSEFNMKVIS